ncbi:uncharacterized protein MONOS_11531 [Monocercomonoides exilis]|uniref:uncharacterized protein n=1 Tax=Monocercomonoides exilis TaxID=2049356 RepID=UPI00355A4D37|nr:hypothetical protein MONOS_11531 [Monocercomonoides exilis]|eukprot:MONOS_11531.1-p1 / transcript=MONOS_11531.1 / gene=MONOS_11531 / organism=Monocercomonoides_exilis_PA203 / gene_product=unspecified product / transcript_product=unspecified product / location=Mono_scaffold00583:15916-16600(-) / protein_length=189 / sequence_SO=supercontig / SO=protein_coding / is_pseudo=false
MSKKGGSKKGKQQVDEELEQLKDLALKGKLRIEALERELFEQKEQARTAMKKKDTLQDKVLDFAEEYNQEKADRHDIVSNMERQYKEMQDYLIQKNKELEQKIEKLQDETAFLHLGYERTIKEKDDAIAEKERTILDLDRKMEDLAEQFRQMLQSTLDKMTEKLKAGGEWEVGLLPDPDKLKQFGVDV